MIYFMYSDEQIAMKNEVLKKVSKQFVPGNVLIGAKRIKYTQMVNDINTMSRFVDAKVVAFGQDTSEFVYTLPTTEAKRGS